MTINHLTMLCCAVVIALGQSCTERPVQAPETGEPAAQESAVVKGTMRRGVGALAEPESTPPSLTSPPKAVDPVQVLSGDKAAPPELADIRAEPEKPSQGDAPTVESKPDAEQAKESTPPKDPLDRLRIAFERLAQCTIGPDGLQVSDTDCVRAFEDALRHAQQEGRKNVRLMRSIEALFSKALKDEHLPLRFYALRGLTSHDRLSTNTRRMLERLMDGDDPVLAEVAAKARLSPITKLSAGVTLVQSVLKEHRHRRVQLAACQFLDRPEMKSSTTFARQLFRLAENNNTPPVVRSCAARVVSRVMRSADQARLRKLLGDPVTAQPALMGLQKATWTDKPWDIALAWYSDNAEEPDKLHWSVMYTMLPPDGQHDGYPRLEATRILRTIVAFKGHLRRTREVGVENLQRLKARDALRDLKEVLASEDSEDSAALLRRVELALR